MTHAAKVARWLPPGTGLLGTEIGAGASPVPGLDPAPIYVDCFKSFGAAPNHADFYGHACALPFHDHTLDYVIASHVLEHVANPVAAFVEWVRVLRPGGLIYLVVPDRRATFDHLRALTPVAHLLDDYRRRETACHATHIDEFARDLDWSRFEPGTTEADAPARRAQLARGLHETVARGEDINIHFHTFEPSNLRELLETLRAPRPPVTGASPAATFASDEPPASRAAAATVTPAASPPAIVTAAPVRPQPAIPRFNWEIVDFAEGFPADCPNGILAVLRVHKGWRARADAEAFRLRTAGEPGAILRPDAQPFAAWAATAPGLGGVR